MIWKLTPVRRRMLIALFSRLLMLFLIVLLAEKLPAYGLIGNTPDYDDYRYEQGAVMYAEEAKSIIDVDTFTAIYDSMGDWTGHNLNRPLTDGYLWYWIVCLLTYFTKWRWWIRILNIILSVFTTKYIYELTAVLFSEKAGRKASMIYAVFPYMIIFSCFSYKDCLVSFCVFYILSFFAKAKKNGKIVNGKIKLALVCLVFILVRSGVSEILIGLSLLYYYFDPGKKLTANKLAVIVLLIGSGLFVLVLTGNLLLYKFNAYIGSASTEGLSGGALVKITGIRDIWKLPLTFLFSVLQPIGFSGNVTSWLSVVSRCNILACPLAIASVLEIILHKRKDKRLSCFLLLFYLLSCVSSILVFRQMYSIWPIPLMYACDLFSHKDWGSKVIVGITSLATAAAVLFFLG